MAYLQQSCLTNPLKFPTHKSKPRTPNPFFIVSCKCPPNDFEQNQDNSPRKLEKQLAKVAMVTFAAGVLTLGSVSDASAAKSGGQIGSQAFGSSAPRSTLPRVNSRTSIFVNPPIAPSLVGGYGFGFGVPFYGGWGSSPFSFFTQGPSITSIVKGGFDLLVLFMCLGFIVDVVDEFIEFDSDDDDEEEEEEEEIINRRRDRG